MFRGERFEASDRKRSRAWVADPGGDSAESQDDLPGLSRSEGETEEMITLDLSEVRLQFHCDGVKCQSEGVYIGVTRELALQNAALFGWMVEGDRCYCPFCQHACPVCGRHGVSNPPPAPSKPR